jgi:chemotaxis regulatin CheY-phosphate phosphatase CheZ
VDIIKREWNSITNGNSDVEIWQHKIHHLRSFLRGWANNLSSVYKKRDRLHYVIDMLDKKLNQCLNESGHGQLKNANDGLAKLRCGDESKRAQRAKVKHIQEGGDNKNIFILIIANGKHR